MPSTEDLVWAARGRGDALLGPLSLQAGRTVLLSGLQGRAELNGQQGTIRSWEGEKQRYGVAVGTSTLALRPGNLRPLYPRVGGGSAAAGSPAANFLLVPVALEDALRWEDATQLQSNDYSLQAHRRCDTRPHLCSPALEVRASLMEGAGDGVFASAGFRKGDMITQFAGVWRGAESIGSEAYSQRTSEGMIEGDRHARDIGAGVAQLINDGSCIGSSCDALLYLQESNARRNVAMAAVEGVVVAVALRDIDAGEELCHSYGMAYWLGRLQRAALLSHDLALSRKCDSEFAAHSKAEVLMLHSGNTAVAWRPTPSLKLDSDGQLVDRAAQAPASEAACRQLCWARLGVESFVLSPPGRQPMECHVLAAHALVMGVLPARIPQWCIDNS